MKSRSVVGEGASRLRVRQHAKRVALGATLLALVGYLLLCVVADLIVVNHLYAAIDGRLSARLHELSGLNAAQLRSERALLNSSVTGVTHDLDDAPVLVWSVPAGATAATALTSGTPELPRADLLITSPVTTRVADRGLRVEGVGTASSGRILVGTSTASVGSFLSALELIEAALGPIALLALFVAATVVGRRAAMPIERMRVGQLDFTADASHELRTPLSVIEAEVGLALSTERSAGAYREALERISQESSRLRDIVDDLLWLARLDSLPTDPEHDAVDVATIVSSCASRFIPVASQRGITLEIRTEGEGDTVVSAPAEWLDRLVSVLLDNACRYSREDGRIDVSVRSIGDQVELCVDDDGPGFDDQERVHLLQRFHRASDVPGGAGLGLAIASAVARATDGSLDLGSSVAGGASVRASWPRRSAVGDGRTTSHARLLSQRGSSS